ncbi:MAG: DUF2505 family protein [Acidimicrobiales bacterium]
MRFSVTETIAASREDVLRSLVDPDYYAYLGDHATSVRAPELLSAADDGGIVHTRVRYAFDGTISGPAARVVDADKLTWVIDTTYDTTTHSGAVVVDPDHYAGLLRCNGTLALGGTDGVTVETVAGVLEVRVPLLAGAAERAILGGFTRHLEIEARALAGFCAGPR